MIFSADASVKDQIMLLLRAEDWSLVKYTGAAGCALDSPEFHCSDPRLAGADPPGR